MDNVIVTEVSNYMLPSSIGRTDPVDVIRNVGIYPTTGRNIPDDLNLQSPKLKWSIVLWHIIKQLSF